MEQQGRILLLNFKFPSISGPQHSFSKKFLASSLPEMCPIAELFPNSPAKILAFNNQQVRGAPANPDGFQVLLIVGQCCLRSLPGNGFLKNCKSSTGFLFSMDLWLKFQFWKIAKVARTQFTRNYLRPTTVR